MDLPFISIIIPVKPGGEVKALEALREADYPKDRLEVIIAEGRQPSAQRNQAVRRAKGEVIFFLDDDSIVPPGHFRTVLKRYEDPDVTAVGGPILTPDTDRFLQKGFGLALSSAFGGSTIRARYKRFGAERAATENDLILANLSFRRERFIEAGGFNERLYPNEENELINRLQGGGADGHKLLYVPDAAIYRSQRKNYRAYLKQVFTYGRGRMDQNYAHPEGFKALHTAPSLFLLYVLSLPLFYNYFVYFLPALLYITLCAAFSAASAVEGKSPFYFLVMPFLFFSLHAGYGAGFIWGLIRGLRHRGSAPEGTGTITIRQVEL